jgi:hypothetical protein
VQINITCTVSNIVLGWEAANTEGIGADPDGATLTWALGSVLLGQSYSSHTGAATDDDWMLKNWGAGIIDVTATYDLALSGWTYNAATGDNQFQMFYSTDGSEASLAMPDSQLIVDEMASGDTSDFDLKITIPTSVSGGGAGAQTIGVILTGSVD